MASIFGKSIICKAGGVTLLGPKDEKGEALNEKTGSVRIVIPSIVNRSVEWPIQITCLPLELSFCFAGSRSVKPSLSLVSYGLLIKSKRNDINSKEDFLLESLFEL